MSPQVLAELESILGERPGRVKPVSGGDISKAYLLETSIDRFFCKVHQGGDALAMFLAEKEGLEAIAKTRAIKTPEVVACKKVGSESILLLEYVESKNPSRDEMERFGGQLAEMHVRKYDAFGWERDNFIGSLPQSNKKTGQWSQFYSSQRLWPQLKLALQNKRLDPLEIPGESRIATVVEGLGGDVSPSIVHGDLWAGNFLISSSGAAYLIDPSVHYAHYEVDLAMSQLFGGFPSDFYQAYHHVNPRQEGYEDRRGLYQLYYLLVHLNLFGPSYLTPVRRWLKHYFGS